MRSFSALLFPTPVLEAEQVTVGEDPSFGNEYFLRAEHLTAGLRWSGLLRGHFEFGTLSFTRPSLILVQNGAGNWNLERWLPPAKRPPSVNPTIFGPQPGSSTANRLQKIDIDDGRLNFKAGNEKLPFAFTGVSGVVEQVAPGRWRLELQAQPWRSGVVLQAAGRLYIRGDVAGTSARLQPAEIHFHWDEVSIADLFRLFRGQDYGVRGLFALDGVARSGAVGPHAAENPQPGDWSYSLQTRATQIHRWDLTERRDNPSLNVNLQGTWNVLSRTATAERLVIQTPSSNMRGSAGFSPLAEPSWQLRVDSAGIQASDLLAWYRAFRPDIDDKISAQQFLAGSVTLRGWPLELQKASFSSQGGELRVPGLSAPLRIGAFTGARDRARFVAGPVRVSYAPSPASPRQARQAESAAKRLSNQGKNGFVDAAFNFDFARHSGSLSLDGHLDEVADALVFASDFGRPLNHGWDLSGPVSASLRREWDTLAVRAAWNGHLDLTNGTLQAAGLNQPLEINKARIEWNNGQRVVKIGEVEAFGTLWSGQIIQPAALDIDPGAKWNFQLHADHLDAADLDRWIGPRARPGWLQRLLPSLLGRLTETSTAKASELLRRINAEGQMRLDKFTLEKIKLGQVRADLAVHDLHLDVRNADAEWAGGKISAKLRAAFLPRPTYDVTAQLDRLNLAQLPAPDDVPERFAGLGSGSVHLVTQGVGRDELLQNLSGKGEVKLRAVEFNGWDLNASVAEGEPHAGASRWVAGEGSFSIRDRSIAVPGLRLESGEEITLVKGSVNFGKQADLAIQVAPGRDSASQTSVARRVLRISGPLDLPRISVETIAARQPAD